MDLKAKLLGERTANEASVELEGVGTVRVRGLTRGEVHVLNKTTNGPETFERRFISLGMLEPQMTEDEVRQWQQVSPAGEIQRVSNKIEELSGLREDATKSGGPDAGDVA